jgi:hypothetical protein
MRRIMPFKYSEDMWANMYNAVGGYDQWAQSGTDLEYNGQVITQTSVNNGLPDEVIATIPLADPTYYADPQPYSTPIQPLQVQDVSQEQIPSLATLESSGQSDLSAQFGNPYVTITPQIQADADAITAQNDTDQLMMLIILLLLRLQGRI